MIKDYITLCQYAYATLYADVHNLDIYTPEQADCAAAEIAYYFQNGFLPDWAYYLDAIERVGDGYVFVHTELGGAQ